MFSPKNRTIDEIMWKKYGKAGQATDDNKVRRMRLAFWITKATDTYSEYVIVVFHCSNGYANAPQY